MTSHDNLNKSKEKKSNGNLIIHLDYFGHIISKDDISKFEEKLRTVNLKLTKYDKTNVLTADFIPFDICIFFSYPLIKHFLDNVGTNISWEIFKYIILSIWKTIQNKTVKKITQTKIIDKKISFGIKTKNGLKSYYLKLPEDYSEEFGKYALDKSLDFLREESLKSDNSINTIAEYFTEDGKWKATKKNQI